MTYIRLNSRLLQATVQADRAVVRRASLRRPCLRWGSVGWVCAYVDRRLVGFVRACWDGGRYAFVLDVAVLPEVRRRGVGTELISRLTSAFPGTRHPARETDTWR